MADAPKYPQYTQDQIDIWLALPLTKAFLECLEWRAGDAKDALGNGEQLDPANSDLNHAISYQLLGKQDAYRDAAQPQKILEHYALVFITDTEEEDDE